MSLWDKKIKPMQSFHSKPFNDPDWIFEVKLDGFRAIAYADAENRNVRLLSKNMIFFDNRFPELADIWKSVNGSRAILDGEIVAFVDGRPDFQKLSSRNRTHKASIEILSKRFPATFVVFDILHLDGKDLVKTPLSERKDILKKTVEEGNRIIHSVYLREHGKDFFDEAKKKGLEGVMAKRLSSLYEQRRSREWLKIKAVNTLDVIIVGYTTGAGRREPTFGSFLCAAYHEGKLTYVGRVGTGLSDEKFEELHPVLKNLRTDNPPFEDVPDIRLPDGRKPIWVIPKLVAEVKFMNITRDMQLRAPVFLRMREDKSPEDCILEFEQDQKE